jgi:hypothetical protein
MSDRDELVELMGRYANMPDSGDCDELPKSVFTDPVTLDFESLSGHPATAYPRAAVMARFKESFSPWAATHHAVTNHQITIDGITLVHAHIRAEHWLPKRSRAMNRTVGWSSASMTTWPSGRRMVAFTRQVDGTTPAECPPVQGGGRNG